MVSETREMSLSAQDLCCHDFCRDCDFSNWLKLREHLHTLYNHAKYYQILMSQKIFEVTTSESTVIIETIL